MAKNSEGVLTPKQLRFCQEYLIDYNATQSYIRAGYSAKSISIANSEGFKLLNKPIIQKKIAELSKKIAQDNELTIEKVIGEISSLAFSNIRDFYDDEGQFKKLSDLTLEQARCIESINPVPLKDGSVQFKIKLHDKNRALEKLMK